MRRRADGRSGVGRRPRERLDPPAPSTRRRLSPRRKKKDKKKKLAAVAEDADPDALDLSQIDLTAPLRADEVMPQRQHRVVEAAPRSEPDWAAPAKPKKKEKKEKKSKKSKKKKGGDAEEDLLGFGTSSPPPPPQPSGDVFDLLGTGDAPPAQAPPVDVRRPAS